MECDVSPEKEGERTEDPVAMEEIVEFTITEVAEKAEPSVSVNIDQHKMENVSAAAESVAGDELHDPLPHEPALLTPPAPAIPEHTLRRSTIQKSVASEVAAKEILLDDSPAKTVKHHHSLRRTVPRIIMKPATTRKKQQQPPDPPATTSSTASTMREVLASIPGFSHVKPRRRTKKMSAAAQLEQTREGCIDLETPDSILVGTNLRALLNKQTFSILPPLYQYKLIQLLPAVDRPDFEGEPSTSSGGGLRLNSSSLNNEFFARACLEWRERLAEGEFTPENQMKLKSEAERDKLKLDPWKLKHFEPIWGGTKKETTVIVDLEKKPLALEEVKQESVAEVHVEPPRRIRTVGAVTRSTTGSLQHQQNSPSKISSPVPDLLPIRTKATRPKEPPPVTVISPQIDDVKESTLKRSSPVPVVPDEQRPGKMSKSEDLTDSPLSCVVEAPQESPPIKEEEEDEEEGMEGVEEQQRQIPEAASQETTQDAPETALQVAFGSVSVDIVLPEEILEEESLEDEEKSQVKIPVKSANLQEHDYVDIGSGSMVKEEDEVEEQRDEVTETSPIVDDHEVLEDFVGETEIVEQQVTCGMTEEEEISAVTCAEEEVDQEKISEAEETTDFTFEGVLEIQPSGLLLEGATLPCLGEDESQSSASVLADCSGDNSVDPAAVEELEPTIQNIPIDAVDHENIEQNFTDAENYVLESGEIVAEDEASGPLSLGTKLCSGEDIQVDLFAAAVARALDTVPVGDAASMGMTAAVVSPSDSSEVIPIQDSLELRLDDSNAYHLPTPWSPVDGASIASTGGESSSGGKMDMATSDTFIVSSGGESSTSDSGTGCKSEPSIVPFSTASQVKLELEVTLAPEAEVSSTVVSQADSDTSSEGSVTTTKSNSTSAIFTPTSTSGSSIVCLPLPLTTVQQQTPFSPATISKMSLAIVSQPQQQQQQLLTTAHAKIQSLTAVSTAKFPTTTMILTTTSGGQKESPIVLTTVKQEPQTPRTTNVGTSSTLPFLAFSAAQPLRSVSNVVNQVAAVRTKSLGSSGGNKGGGGGGRRSQNNKPPPGAVNLERSYQICQAVIQNSPNRHQLKHQLRPPPSMLAAAAAASSGSDNSNSSESGSSSGGSRKDDQTQHGAVTSTNRTVYKIQGNTLRGGLQKKTFGQRQASPLLVRQVFTASSNNSSNQGTSGNFISVIPSAGSVQSQQTQQQQIVHADGQYVLVQRAGIDNCSMPRASSAPPAQNQQIHGVNGIPISNRGRPASVEVDSLPEQQMILVGPNPGVQAVTRRGPNQVYGDISMDPSLQNFGLAGEGTPPNCACSLNAMVICQQCGNFSHASCVGTSKLCVACDIR
ncbi:hypothetical protein DMENIID0001_127620 [Sergentomyia squamirostris]